MNLLEYIFPLKSVFIYENPMQELERHSKVFWWAFFPSNWGESY